MSERTPGGGDEAMDLEVLARDDALLDALGRGTAAPDGDRVATMLAAWHADLDADPPATAEVRPAVPVRDAPAPVPLPVRRRARARRLAAAAVALLALLAGLGIGSRDAGPGSPLWSLTRLLHSQRAEVREVEEQIVQARTALSAGRLDEAGSHVDRGRRELADVDDPATAARLRAALDAVARDLAAARASGSGSAPAAPAPGHPAATATPGPSGTTPAPRPRPSHPATSTAPGPSVSGGGPLPSLPGLPLPTVPSLSSLPGLPLPTGGLLD